MKTLEELRHAGLGHGAFDIGYGRVAAGDSVEGGVDKYRTGQVVEVFHDGDAWVEWDDNPGCFDTIKWRYIRKYDRPSAPLDGKENDDEAK